MEPLFLTGVVFWFIGQTTLGLTNFEISISVFHLWNQIGSSNLVGGRSYWSFKLFSAMYLEEILFSSSLRLTFWIVPLFSTHPIYHSTPDKEVRVSEWVRKMVRFSMENSFWMFWFDENLCIWKCQTWYKHICLKTWILAEKRRLLMFNRMWPSRQKSTSWQIKRRARYIL